MSVFIVIEISGIVLFLAGLMLFRKRQSRLYVLLSVLLMGMGILLLLTGWGLFLMSVEDAQG